jgi:hypothetical protein
MEETTPHLPCECNFTDATWTLIVEAFNLPNYGIGSEICRQWGQKKQEGKLLGF